MKEKLKKQEKLKMTQLYNKALLLMEHGRWLKTDHSLTFSISYA